MLMAMFCHHHKGLSDICTFFQLCNEIKEMVLARGEIQREAEKCIIYVAIVIAY